VKAGVLPSELEYVTLMASGVAADPAIVTGNVIEFAPGASPSGDVAGFALPIEIVKLSGPSALPGPAAAKSSVPANRAAMTRRPPSPNFPPI
jgi:hypothetical protein